jgi:hypothetical protein
MHCVLAQIGAKLVKRSFFSSVFLIRTVVKQQISNEKKKETREKALVFPTAAHQENCRQLSAPRYSIKGSFFSFC